ncbi:MAG: hypothetical protein ABSD71_13940, partial [Bacteroidales bacterium]
YQSIPLKKLSKEIGLTYEQFRKLIHQMFKDIIQEDTPFYIDIKEVEYEITLTGRKNTVYFITKSLPILPRIGEEIQFPYFKEYVGEDYFYVKNIRHDFYGHRQIISIQLEGGHYSKWWHIRRDEAIEKGEVGRIEGWFNSDRSLKKVIGTREKWHDRF